MSELLRQVYASAPAGVYRHLTVELLHPSFPGGAWRFVQGHDALTATLETQETVTFQPSGIGILPPRRGTQEQPTLTLQLDNVTLEASSAIEDASEAGGYVTVMFREFVSSDLSAPENTPTPLYASAARADRASVILSAGFLDLVNRQWPRKRYTVDLAPGLQYL